MFSKYYNSFLIILIFLLVGTIKAKTVNINNNENENKNKNKNNKYYIITIKDRSTYSYVIQPSKQNENENIILKKKDLNEKEKFKLIDIVDVEDIITSNDCYFEINKKNLNDTTLCQLNKNKETVLNKKGEIDIEKLEKKLIPKPSFVSEQLEILAELIMDNIDTYENDDIISNEIHNIIKKRSMTSLKDIIDNKAFSKILKKILDILDVTVIRAYLSEKVVELIKTLSDVVECIEDIKINIPNLPIHENKKSKNEPKNNKDKNTKENNYQEIIYYNITDIIKDTNWKNISIEEHAGNHLSLISQSKVDMKLIGQYDENYYYPTSAGEGVDIYIIDSGININHKDFDATYRTVSCDAYVDDFHNLIKINKNDEKFKNCGENYPNQFHGIAVASAAAGTINGVAKKANIHMINAGFFLIDTYILLDFIEKNAKNPHKTVINMSFNSYSYSNTLDKLINILVRKGFMLIASSGNDSTNSCITDTRYIESLNRKVNDKSYPCAYNDVICVGSFENNVKPSGVYSLNNPYPIANFSNYGNCVDIFAPGFANLASFPNDITKNKIYSNTNEVKGTSYSSPIVSGIAALLISENPEIEFNQSILKKMLIDLSVKDAITNLENLDSPNNIVNIGKKIVYSSNNEYNKFLLYNYWTDLYLKYIPENSINENIQLTLYNDNTRNRNHKNENDFNYSWNINNNNYKIIQNNHLNICLNINNTNGIVYAGNCTNPTIFNTISEFDMNDTIQSEKYPGMCLKGIKSDFNPYGITLFTESKGIRVRMDPCDENDETQHWRIKNISENIRYKSRLWIYNVEKKLCLSFDESDDNVYNYNFIPLILQKCDINYTNQQWLVPDNYHGYYTNIANDYKSIVISPDKKILFGDYVDTIILDKIYVRNVSAILSLENEALKVSDGKENTELCLNISENQNQNNNKNNIYLNVIPCNQSNNHWKLTTEFPLK
ncbi:subtilisin-like protein [Anaeromyces robustus]|uniref:Subtilisin-like protein n=1 Tax=Anaeromyces robustus TaxID=1754192 RepID=A0A1Y1WYU3_9FUNG|nr:subtilisin-like protein [Anaeromyces robustus]|eukprot:ORX78747.1 subtilisin-like protein [Anaeromyces robustus]